MIVDSIIKIFENNCDERGIPLISNAHWNKIKSFYDKDDIRESLANYIVKNKIPFPLKLISEEKMQKLFYNFCNKSMINLYSDSEHVDEKFDYKHKYYDHPLGVIGGTHAFNNVADFFQQENRMKCGSINVDSPYYIWNNEDLLRKMNWHFWREGVLENDDINDKTFRSSFRLGTYTATQFKPTVAKALYEKHNAVNILDTSCGWGDRLAGFYGTSCSKLYVGCDPNPDVFEIYKEQCLFYEKVLWTMGLASGKTKIDVTDNYFKCTGSKVVEIWNLPAEDVDWNQYNNKFDFYFTSPPYFETEKYALDTKKSENQSWSRYNSFEKWRDEFFFHVTKLVWSTLKDNAYMMINIIEPNSKGKRHNLCDSMVDEFINLDNCFYIGKIGMRMATRPHMLAKGKNHIYIEPIWSFKKGNGEYNKKISSATLENFF